MFVNDLIMKVIKTLCLSSQATVSPRSGHLTQNTLAVINSGANVNKSHKVFYYLPRVTFSQFHVYY